MAGTTKAKLIALTAEITASYVENNTVAAGDIPRLIQGIFASLQSAEGLAPSPDVPFAPAVPIKRSVTDDYLICLEDGLKFKSLSRHLKAKYNLTPKAYRAKWRLPQSYPMVAPAYAASRSALAKQMGLGQRGRSNGNATAAAETTAPEPASAD